VAKGGAFQATFDALRRLLKPCEPAHLAELETLTKKGFDGFLKKFQ